MGKIMKTYEFLLKENYFGSCILYVDTEFDLKETISQVEYLIEGEVLSYKEWELEDEQKADVVIERIIKFIGDKKHLNN